MPKTICVKSEAAIMQEIDEQCRERDEKFILGKLAKAEQNLAKAEKNWHESGGYGSRAAIYRWDDQVRLCRLALKAVEISCGKCSKRNERIYQEQKKLESLKEQGKDSISIKNAMDMINRIW